MTKKKAAKAASGKQSKAAMKRGVARRSSPGQAQLTGRPVEADAPEAETGVEGAAQRAGLPFPVVGIGASAGGLEAFTQLLQQVRGNINMAFVLVQHLDPRHASMLTELLSRTSTLPVVEVTEGMPVEANRVHVIPANKEMIVAQGVLHLSPRSDSRSPHMPIDSFLRSLAREQQSRAIGVILSGASSDGSAGLEAIKAEGGITFAQDPETAKYDGMPRSAIATGCVDFVLPPAKIAEELAGLGIHPYVSRPEELRPDQLAPEETDDLRKILAILRSSVGLDFHLYRQTTIRRRILRRMAVHRIDSLKDYVKFLSGNPAEAQALYSELLIKVTSFFRDPDVFESLKNAVFPAIVRNRRPDSAIRIWVPACSTGEEAYSIAISLLEYLNQISATFPIQIFATDVSEAAIEKARSGTYMESIALDVSPGRLRRFFVKTETGYQVSKAVRELCVFARQDVTKDPPFSKLDLISCRNLLIYLEPALQKKVIPIFHFSLKRDGFLLLGSSETVAPHNDLFSVVDKTAKIYAKAAAMAPPAVELAAGESASPGTREIVKGSLRPEEPWGGLELSKEADRTVLAKYAPPGVIIDEELKVLQFRGRTSPFLEPAPGRASLNLLRLAREGLALELRAAVEKARKTGESVRKRRVAMRTNDQMRDVDFEVIPLKSAPERHYLVLFEFSPKAHEETGPAVEKAGRKPAPEDRRKIASLRQELAATREYLQSIIEEQEASNEELQSANEEILSSNEELQSINEELETAKEELQSTNEELTTVNDELQNRNLELGQANSDLNNLLSNIDIPIIMLGSDLRIQRFTPKAGKVLNVIPADAGRHISDIRLGIDVPDLEQMILTALDKVAVQERDVLDREGHWFHLSIRPYRTLADRIDGAVLSLVDVDQLKRGLEEVRRARDFAQAIVETAGEPLAVLDERLQLTAANKAFHQAFRLAPEEAGGESMDRLVAHNPALRRLLEEVVPRDGKVIDFELEYDLPEAGSRTLLVNARKIQGGPDGQEFILFSFQDITERKRREVELRTSEARYQQLFHTAFETARDGIVLVDAGTGEILDANPAVLEMMGLDREAVLGRKCWEIEELRPLAGDQAEFSAIREQGYAQGREGMTFHPAGGRRREIDVVTSFFQAGGKNIIQHNFRDITERTMLMQQLRHSQRLDATGRMAGGIAHDFNNLLTVIVGYTQMVLDELEPDDPMYASVGEILKASNRGADLISQLLTFTRHQVIQPKLLDLTGIVAGMDTMLGRVLGEDIELREEVAPDLGYVKGDSGQMEQVLMNVAVNAREAMPHGGKLTVRLANYRLSEEEARARTVPPGDYVLLEIQDTGRGILPEVQAQIFEPFFTTKDRGQGTGLGLSTVYGIVKQAGGDVWVESEPGKGATFRILLPRVQGEVAPKPEPPPVEPAGGSETILVVEDEEGVRRLSGEILSRRGYNILDAKDPEEALRLCREHPGPIHLLLADVVMPQSSGPDLAAKVLEIHPETRVLFMSGYTEDNLARQGADIAGERFLTKPFSPDVLARKVRQVLNE